MWSLDTNIVINLLFLWHHMGNFVLDSCMMYLEPCQRLKMKRFAKIVAKHFIFDVLQGCEYYLWVHSASFGEMVITNHLVFSSSHSYITISFRKGKREVIWLSINSFSIWKCETEACLNSDIFWKWLTISFFPCLKYSTWKLLWIYKNSGLEIAVKNVLPTSLSKISRLEVFWKKMFLRNTCVWVSFIKVVGPATLLKSRLFNVFSS